MTLHLRVDPVKCTGHGMCAEILPELIELDDWGYPLLGNGGVVPRDLEGFAQTAAEYCPTLALLLERKHEGPRAGAKPKARHTAPPVRPARPQTRPG